MNQRTKTVAISILLVASLGLTGMAMADDAVERGDVDFHYTYLDVKDSPSLVAEYEDLRQDEEFSPRFDLRLDGSTSSVFYRTLFDYQSERSFGHGFDLYGADWKLKTRSRSFMHNLRRDGLQNMQAREVVSDGNGGFVPGGKQVYNDDLDPEGVYEIRYERVQTEFEWLLPYLNDKVSVYAAYDAHRREGFKQIMSLDHCAFCHVSSQGRRIDDETKTWRTGVKAEAGMFTLDYGYEATHFVDHTAGSSNVYDLAAHPVSGASAGEFGPRLNFTGTEEEVARRPASVRQEHSVNLTARLPKENMLRAAYSHVQRENQTTNLEGTVDSYAGAWMSRPTKKSKLVARVMAYESKVDDVYVDLDPYREGRPGGGQDFDWTRISAANRNVVQGDLDFGIRPRKGTYVKASYRYRMTDRDAMAQTQTTYVNDNGTDLEIPSTPFENKTTENRLRLMASQRLGRKGSVRASATLKLISDPFENPTAMDEHGLHGTDVGLAGQPNGWVYYFQRSRYGAATNQPTMAQRYNVQGSYQVHPRSAISAFGTVGVDENDELDTYQFDSTMYALGVNAWAAPTEQVLLTAGYVKSQYKSNARLSPPLFDG